MDGSTRRRALQAATLALVTAPLAAIGVRALTGDLGANPIEELTHATGEWSLRFLLLALAVTPLRRWLGWSWLAPLRRTLGLAAFAWVCLHLSVWTVLDQFFDWEAMLEDVLDRRYITVGFLGFLCLLPLAVTSTRSWMRRDALPVARQGGPRRAAGPRRGAGGAAGLPPPRPPAVAQPAAGASASFGTPWLRPSTR